MAPKRNATPVDADDTDDKPEEPNWDSNERSLMLYLLMLKRWLPKQRTQFNNFIRFGFIINGRQEVVAFNDTHKSELQDGSGYAQDPSKACAPWDSQTKIGRVQP